MLEKLDKHFAKLYWLVCLCSFIVIAVRSYLIPFSHDEVATFYFYIQPQKFIPFYSHVDANGHFLTSATSWLSYKFFGSSPFALRLPNLFGFIVLCWGVWRIFPFLQNINSKLVLTSAFIVSFHFLSFFSLCRGYAFSMSFLVLSVSFLFSYLSNKKFNHFFSFVLFAQLALSANLTLVLVLLTLTLWVIIIQVKHQLIFKINNLALMLVHLALILYWVKYGFYLQENGALYYGSGTSYWQVTFVSLIETVLFKSIIVNSVILLLLLVLTINFIIWSVQQSWSVIVLKPYFISFVSFILLVSGFFLLKLIFHVNYPEDRTGLFFYVFFILALTFMLQESSSQLRVSLLVIPVFFLCHFIFSFNLHYHPWKIYETFPQRFIEALQQEQDKTQQSITVAGHRLREFIYGFMNYNSTTKLNHITSPEALQMNTDYAIAYAVDKPFYQKYYNEIDSENVWNFRLLKRKFALEKKLLFKSGEIRFNGEYEFYNAYEKLDTTFNNINPVQAEFNFTVEEICVPFNAWLAIGIDDADGVNNSTVRIPLNLIKHNWWETDNFTTCIVTGNIPKRIKRIVCYLWNIDKQPIKIRINEFRLYQLFGEGVTEISKAEI